ncbi:MAG: hypothetical protein M1370_05495, partial [Bacteroidetes bacterium]|nr:hypothetical protein [Bacteroidota bacterium]
MGVRGDSRWQTDELIVERRWLGIPGDAVPGQYRLVIGLDAPAARRRLSAVGDDGASLGTEVPLGTLEVTKGPGQPNLALLPIQHRLARAPDAIDAPLRLLGYNLAASPLRSGDAIPITLFWQAADAPHRDYQMRLRLVDASGTSAAEQAGPPAGGSYPTGRWSTREVVRDYRHLLIPATTASGQYTLQVEVLDGAQPVGPPVTLGTLDVQERPHQFDLPSVQSPLAVDLGEGVRLLGYDLSTSAPALGQTVRLTLYWQARGSMDTSYTVFVHLLDGEQKVVSQHDGLPGEGRMPTTAWAKDEVVSATHELAL